MRNLKLQYLGSCVLQQVKYALRTKFKCLNIIWTWYLENWSGGVLLYKISENLLESKPFKTSRELPYFKQNSVNLCTYLICIQLPKDI